MHSTTALKFVLITLALCITSGCKLLVMVPVGGSVAFSEAVVCNPQDPGPVLRTSWSFGRLCEIDITDTNFSRGFTAEPQPGFEFVSWRDGKGFQCGGSTNPTCTVELKGNAVASLVVNSQNAGFLMPIFKDVGIDTDDDGTPDRKDEDDDNDGVLDGDDDCPLSGPNQSGFGCPVITDTISRVGKDWAQVTLFNDVSWREMNAACPGGTCLERALLQGYDMTGWRWATSAEIHVLVNSYGSDIPLVVTKPYSLDRREVWGLNFFDGGWQPNSVDFDPGSNLEKRTEGLVSDPLGAGTGQPATVRVQCINCASTVRSSYYAEEKFQWQARTHIATVGGYFYRSDSK